MAKQYTLTENRFERSIEQWETEYGVIHSIFTEYGVKELGIYGIEMIGLVQSLASEVDKLRTLCAEQKKQLETYDDMSW